MFKVKNVEMLDYNKNKILVTGVMSSDKTFVSATTIRKFKNTKADPSKGIKEKIQLRWKKSKSGHICTLGMGDNAIFTAKNVSEPDENGYVTADLIQLTPTTQVTILKFKDNNGVEGSPFPGSILDAKISFRNGEEITFAELLPDSHVKTVIESIKLGAKETATRPRNAEYAELANEYTDAIAEPEIEVTKEEEYHGEMTAGQSAAEVMGM